jgi:molybdate transport system ATP-binding protein
MAYGQEVYLFGRLRGSGETIWETKANFGVVSNEIHYRYLQTPSVIDVVVSGFFDSLGLYSEPSSKQIEIGKLWLRSIAPSVGFTESYAELSFGQQRLVLLARAMVKLPRVLILDEACVGLDDEHIANLINIIDTIAKSSRTRILYVSHENGPRPKCLNKKLSFVENADRSFSVVESDL